MEWIQFELTVLAFEVRVMCVRLEKLPLCFVNNMDNCILFCKKHSLYSKAIIITWETFYSNYKSGLMIRLRNIKK